MSIVQKGIEDLEISVGQFLRSLGKITPIEQAQALVALGETTAKVLMKVLWDIYLSGSWLTFNKKSDANSRVDYQEYMLSFIYTKNDENGNPIEPTEGEAAYAYQKRKIIDVLAWTNSHTVLLNGERVMPDYLISVVAITRFLQAMPKFNACQTDEERAWIVYQLARGDRIVTPLHDMVFIPPPPQEDAPETFSEEAPEDGEEPPAKKQRVELKQNTDGTFTIKIKVAPNQILALKEAVSPFVEWN